MIRRFISLCVVTVLITMVHVANAQLQLPRPSPGAEITQTAGLTDITISYSSPGVKGREIFGGLVAYDKIWRTGANASTKITFSKDVMKNIGTFIRKSISTTKLSHDSRYTIMQYHIINVIIMIYNVLISCDHLIISHNNHFIFPFITQCFGANAVPYQIHCYSLK